jgi:hypothetical protein
VARLDEKLGETCHPGAIERRWTRECVLDAMRLLSTRYGDVCLVAHSRAHERRGGAQAADCRGMAGDERGEPFVWYLGGLAASRAADD